MHFVASTYIQFQKQKKKILGQFNNRCRNKKGDTIRQSCLLYKQISVSFIAFFNHVYCTNEPKKVVIAMSFIAFFNHVFCTNEQKSGNFSEFHSIL